MEHLFSWVGTLFAISFWATEKVNPIISSSEYKLEFLIYRGLAASTEHSSNTSWSALTTITIDTAQPGFVVITKDLCVWRHPRTLARMGTLNVGHSYLNDKGWVDVLNISPEGGVFLHSADSSKEYYIVDSRPSLFKADPMRLLAEGVLNIQDDPWLGPPPQPLSPPMPPPPIPLLPSVELSDGMKKQEK